MSFAWDNEHHYQQVKGQMGHLLKNVCILSEDPRGAEHVKSLLANYPAAHRLSISHFASMSKLSESIGGSRSIHLLLHDIVSPGECTDIQFIKKYFPRESGTQIIYLSEYLQTALDVYEPDRVHFLLKPLSQAKFNAAIDRALENLQAVPVAQCTLTLMAKGRRRIVAPDSISYIESDLRQLHIHTIDETLDVYLKLSEIADQLPETFVRCHRSFLVNSAAVASFTRDDITLVNGQIIPVSKSRCRKTWESLQRLSTATFDATI